MNSDDPTQPQRIAALSRRVFLRGAGSLAVSLPATAPVAAAAVTQAAAAAAATEPARPSDTATLTTVRLRVNGRQHLLQLEPRVTLLDALREDLGLVGTKKGCDRGQCGACTVLVDGRRINACLTLAVMRQGAEITTIEGLGTPDAMHPVQAAFVERDAFQCGYCTPGQICAAVALLTEMQAGDVSAVTPDVRRAAAAMSDDEIRERMSGNLCRCGAYPNIVAAVQQVAAAPATRPMRASS